MQKLFNHTLNIKAQFPSHTQPPSPSSLTFSSTYGTTPPNPLNNPNFYHPRNLNHNPGQLSPPNSYLTHPPPDNQNRDYQSRCCRTNPHSARPHSSTPAKRRSPQIFAPSQTKSAGKLPQIPPVSVSLCSTPAWFPQGSVPYIKPKLLIFDGLATQFHKSANGASLPQTIHLHHSNLSVGQHFLAGSIELPPRL